MLPETPVWLAARGRTEEAKESLLWLRGPGLNTDKEYQELCEAQLKRKEKKESLLRALHMPNVWKPFLILLSFFALQQLSGIYVILFYVVNVLKDIGIDVNEYAASVGVGVIRLFASILGAGLANNIGRKTLAFVSGFGMAVAAGGVALSSRFVIVTLVTVYFHDFFSTGLYFYLHFFCSSHCVSVSYFYLISIRLILAFSLLKIGTLFFVFLYI